MDRDYSDPSRTLSLLNELEGLGLRDDEFAVLHHFKEPEKISNHRKYCERLAEDGNRFRTLPNKRVQRRLEMVLAMYKAGGFRSSSREVFRHLAEASVAEIPHDRRPLSEQVG
jgi:hypothetical protein